MLNDGVHGCSINASIDVLAVITRMWAYVSIRVDGNEYDKNYRQEVLNTVVDVERALRGNQKNFLVAMIIQIILKSTETELNFPLKKVSF
jgi:hypothetical protein